MGQQPVKNGAVAMPVKTARIEFDDIGYAGWYAVVRTDPRSSVYDDLVAFEDGKWWPAFGQVVLEWNLTDEDGNPHPLPRELKSERDLDLRVGVITFLFVRYIEAVKAASAIPKASESGSDASSPTNGVATASAKA